MRGVIVLCFAFLLLGCREEVSRTQVGEPVVVTAETSCRVAGMCITCGLGFDGKMSCGLRFSASCPGKHIATVESTLYEVLYDDGSRENYTYRKTLSSTACHQ